MDIYLNRNYINFILRFIKKINTGLRVLEIPSSTSTITLTEPFGFQQTERL